MGLSKLSKATEHIGLCTPFTAMHAGGPEKLTACLGEGVRWQRALLTP